MADPEVLGDLLQALPALLLADRLVDVGENRLRHLPGLFDLGAVVSGLGVMDDLWMLSARASCIVVNRTCLNSNGYRVILCTATMFLSVEQ